MNNSKIEKGQQFKISFNVSGATAFQQLVVQSNVNGWAWDEAPKIYKEGGIQDDEPFDAVITATEDQDWITFKLWFDSPTEEGFESDAVTIILNNLIITDVTPVEPTETPEPEPTETPEPTTEPEVVE